MGLVIALAIAVTAGGCGARHQGAAPQPPADAREGTRPLLRAGDYFPAHLGARWKYAGWGNEFAAYDAYVSHQEGRRVQIVVESGARIASVYEVSQERVVRLFRSAEMEEPDELLEHPAQEPYTLLEGPLVPGREWAPYGPDHEGANELRRVESVGSSLQTPAGRFDNAVCIRVIRGEGPDSRECYAPGIGMVRSEFLAEEPIISALSFFSLGRADADPFLGSPSVGEKEPK